MTDSQIKFLKWVESDLITELLDNDIQKINFTHDSKSNMGILYVRSIVGNMLHDYDLRNSVRTKIKKILNMILKKKQIYVSFKSNPAGFNNFLIDINHPFKVKENE